MLTQYFVYLEIMSYLFVNIFVSNILFISKQCLIFKLILFIIKQFVLFICNNNFFMQILDNALM